MAFTPSLSPFFARFFRPFSTSSASLSLQPNAGSASGATDSMSRLSYPAHAQRATIAAGCFWGVEQLYRKQFGGGRGLLDARVGYTGGETSSSSSSSSSPTYRQVCSGNTGHAESLLIVFDPAVVSYRALIEFFFRMHDPTTLNRQGMDAGTQYRSAIFAHDEAQLATAHDVKERVGKEWYAGRPVTTEIAIAGRWFDAEEYHQLYLENNPGGYECPAHFVRNFPPLSE